MNDKRDQNTIDPIEKLCDTLEKLAEATWDKFYEHRLLHTQRQWQMQSIVDDAQTRRFEQAAARCQATIDEHRKYAEVSQRQAALLDELKTDVAAHAHQSHHDRDQRAYIEEYQRRWGAELAIEIPKEQQQKQWHKYIEYLISYADALGRLHDAHQSIQAFHASDGTNRTAQLSAIRTLIKDINWPQNFVKPDNLLNLQTLCDELSEVQQRKTEGRKKQLQRTDKLIVRLAMMLRNKITRGAVAVREELSRQVEKLNADERLRYQERIERLDKDMQDLMDWKAFASEPKAIELCTAMESLAVNPRTPQEQLKALRVLQQQWSKLGHSPATQKHWSLFKEITDKALKPCADLIARQQAYRAQNQKYAEQACTQLNECVENLDTPSPDWKKAKRVLEESQAMMERNKNLPRLHAEAIRERYKVLRTQCEAKLRPIASTHETQKHTLLAHAERVAQKDAGTDQIRQTKLLLAHWEQLLKGPNEKKLHARLEEILKATLEQLHQEKDQHQQESAQQKNRIQEAISTMQEWMRLDDERLLSVESKYQQLLEDTRPLLTPAEETLTPRKYRHSKSARPKQTLEQQFERATEQLERHLQELPKRQQQKYQNALQQYVRLCQDLEWSDSKTRELAMNALKEAAPMLQKIDRKIRSLMEARQDAAIANKQSGDSDERRLLCVRLEILADVVTPDEDLALRNNYLMEQMQKGTRIGAMSQEEIRADAHALYLKYLSNPVAEAKLEKMLAERVAVAMDAFALREKTKESQRTSPHKKRTRQGRHGAPSKRRF